jgi:hypothetical protein
MLTVPIHRKIHSTITCLHVDSVNYSNLILTSKNEANVCLGGAVSNRDRECDVSAGSCITTWYIEPDNKEQHLLVLITVNTNITLLGILTMLQNPDYGPFSCSRVLRIWTTI